MANKIKIPEKIIQIIFKKDSIYGLSQNGDLFEFVFFNSDEIEPGEEKGFWSWIANSDLYKPKEQI